MFSRVVIRRTNREEYLKGSYRCSNDSRVNWIDQIWCRFKRFHWCYVIALQKHPNELVLLCFQHPKKWIQINFHEIELNSLVFILLAIGSFNICSFTCQVCANTFRIIILPKHQCILCTSMGLICFNVRGKFNLHWNRVFPYFPFHTFFELFNATPPRLRINKNNDKIPCNLPSFSSTSSTPLLLLTVESPMFQYLQSSIFRSP